MSNKPKFEKVRIDTVKFDHRFQRELDEARARAMSKSFSWALFGVPVLSQREDGSRWALDAQHRLCAAVMAGHGEASVLMEIHTGLTLAEEAEMFLRLNGGRSAVGIHDKWKARIVAKEPVALQIQQELKDVGNLRISRSAAKFCVMAIKAVERAHHRSNLVPTMRVLTHWLDGAPEAYEGKLVDGVSVFLVQFPDADPGTLAEKLQNHSPIKVLAALNRTRGGMECTAAIAACVVMRDIYNEKMKKGQKRLPPVDMFGDVAPSQTSIFLKKVG